MSRYIFKIKQNGIFVVEGDATTLMDAAREVRHYARIYAQDGPIEVTVKRARKQAAKARSTPEAK